MGWPGLINYLALMFKTQTLLLLWIKDKISEMQKGVEVFKLNLNYYQREAHKKLS